LIAADGALVVNVSYYGAVSYHLDPAYGATKAGLDKLTFDMAQDFKPYNGCGGVDLARGRQPRRDPSPSSRRSLGVTRYSQARETPKFFWSRYRFVVFGSATDVEIGKRGHRSRSSLEYGFKDFNGKQPPQSSRTEGLSRARFFNEELIFRLREPPFLTASRNCQS